MVFNDTRFPGFIQILLFILLVIK